MTSNCEFTPTSEPHVYRCRRCGFTTRPTHYSPSRIHRACRQWDPRNFPLDKPEPSRGLGDAVAWWIDKLSFGRLKGSEGCGCERRRAWLNRLLPFRRERSPVASSSQKATARQQRLLLRFPHGLGDAVQLTTVLLHFRALRPEWTIDIEAKIGAHSLFAGLAHRVFVAGRDAFRAADYDLVHTLAWHEPSECYRDSPSTKAERCLREVFSIPPKPAWCRYHIGVGRDAMDRAASYLQTITGKEKSQRYPVVVLHYQGNSARRRKNLDEQVARRVVDRAVALGYVVLLLDFEAPPRNTLLRDPSPHWPRGAVACPGGDHPLWHGRGTGDGETLAALIAQAALFIGIDSGPAHIAGATNTPSVVVWTGHHPLHYFGLADNALHLVPDNHESLLLGDREAGGRFFAAHYRHRVYRDLALALPRVLEEGLRNAEPGAPTPLMVDGDRWVRAEHRQADMVIVRDVDWEDCYRLAELRFRPRTILDIGAHIGCFANRARRRWPAAEIACVEANPDNLGALRANVRNDVTVFPFAATYAPGPVTVVSSLYPGSDNSGASFVEVHGGDTHSDKRPRFSVATVQLEQLLERLRWQSIDLLKLDCEGCEFSLLENTPSLDRIGVIVGEFHDRERFERLLRTRFAAWHVLRCEDRTPGLFTLVNPEVDVPRE
jgi:FkbM family methyltransferase